MTAKLNGSAILINKIEIIKLEIKQSYRQRICNFGYVHE